MKLKDKVIWITGASSGIGEAVATALAKEEANLVLSARRENELNRVKENLHLSENKVVVLPLDLEKPEEFEAKKNEVLKVFGQIDILINSGGVSQRSLAKDTTVETERRIMDINFFGTLALTKTVLPVFQKQKSGMFVAVSSVVGKYGTPWRSAYAASKHALHGYFDSLRAELHDDGVKVLIVCPGFIVTNISYNALTGDGQKLGSMDQATSKGLSKEECARQLVTAIKAEKEEVIISRFKEKLGVYVKRFAPQLFSIMIRKIAVR